MTTKNGDNGHRRETIVGDLQKIIYFIYYIYIYTKNQTAVDNIKEIHLHTNTSKNNNNNNKSYNNIFVIIYCCFNYNNNVVHSGNK